MCMSYSITYIYFFSQDSMDSKTSSSSSTKHQLVLSPPILTDIVTRDGMTIIKLDSLAINHLRTAGNTNDNNPHYYHWATTGPVKIKPIGMPKIKVTIKMYWNGCTQQTSNKFLSIFILIDDYKSPITDTLYISLSTKNIKNEDGQSMKKSFKILPSTHRMEGGIKEYLPLSMFDSILQRDSVVTFGILIKKNP